MFKNCILYNGTESEVGRTGIMVEREFQRLCQENHVDQLLNDEMKSEARDEIITQHGDFESHINVIPHGSLILVLVILM